jgi:hypothetical protein
VRCFHRSLRNFCLGNYRGDNKPFLCPRLAPYCGSLPNAGRPGLGLGGSEWIRQSE